MWTPFPLRVVSFPLRVLAGCSVRSPLGQRRAGCPPRAKRVDNPSGRSKMALRSELRSDSGGRLSRAELPRSARLGESGRSVRIGGEVLEALRTSMSCRRVRRPWPSARGQCSRSPSPKFSTQSTFPRKGRAHRRSDGAPTRGAWISPATSHDHRLRAAPGLAAEPLGMVRAAPCRSGTAARGPRASRGGGRTASSSTEREAPRRPGKGQQWEHRRRRPRAASSRLVG